jgi:hypothetical protein
MVSDQAREVAKALFIRRVSEDQDFEGLVELYVEALSELHELKYEGPPAWKHTEARLRKENLSLVEQLHEARGVIASLSRVIGNE